MRTQQPKQYEVVRQVSTFVLGAKRDRQPEESAPQKRGRRGGR
jgi:hypothetical protein